MWQSYHPYDSPRQSERRPHKIRTILCDCLIKEFLDTTQVPAREDACRRWKSCRKRFGVDDLVTLGKKPLKDLYAWVS
jgi:hypothetical protein